MLYLYDHITSLENLFQSWREFLRGKKRRRDVLEFSIHLSKNIYDLHSDLQNQIYHHGSYVAFKINDPKPRDIHKATVRDRVLHHAVCRVLYVWLERRFIYDSYSCRFNKGTHRAINRLLKFGRQASKNFSQNCWVLKCDLKKFFASINHQILFKILSRYELDLKTRGLIEEIVNSFNSGCPGLGLPLGNLTSQLLVNAYLNEFDQFVKRELKVKYYIRYADDFVVLAGSQEYLFQLLPKIKIFLGEKLRLDLHPNKVLLKTFSSGVDFLGWIHFPDHRVLRTATKRRMLKKLATTENPAIVASYLGMLKWGNAHKLAGLIDAWGELC